MDYLCVFAKAPKPGQTKSRLAQDFGPLAAAELSRAMLIDLCHQCLRVENSTLQIWMPPEAAIDDFKPFTPNGFSYHYQRGNDLGARLSATFHCLLGEGGSHRVVIVGSDCVTHDCQSLRSALVALHHGEVVIQPAWDGGYALIGLTHWRPQLFANVNWGADTVLEQTLAQLKLSNQPYQTLPATFDVDRSADVDHLNDFLTTHPRPETARWMRKYYPKSPKPYLN